MAKGVRPQSQTTIFVLVPNNRELWVSIFFSTFGVAMVLYLLLPAFDGVWLEDNNEISLLPAIPVFLIIFLFGVWFPLYSILTGLDRFFLVSEEGIDSDGLLRQRRSASWKDVVGVEIYWYGNKNRKIGLRLNLIEGSVKVPQNMKNRDRLFREVLARFPPNMISQQAWQHMMANGGSLPS